jgi:uncharacterized membrane protein YphA (DoxX/SURF4 family)
MVHIILSIVLAVLFVATGTPKIIGLPFSLKGRDALDLPAWFWRLTGTLEVLGALGLVLGIWSEPLQVFAPSALALFMLAAASARIRGVRRAGVRLAKARNGVLLDLAVFVVLVVEVVLIAQNV